MPTPSPYWTATTAAQAQQAGLAGPSPSLGAPPAPKPPKTGSKFPQHVDLGPFWLYQAQHGGQLGEGLTPSGVSKPRAGAPSWTQPDLLPFVQTPTPAPPQAAFGQPQGSSDFMTALLNLQPNLESAAALFGAAGDEVGIPFTEDPTTLLEEVPSLLDAFAPEEEDKFAPKPTPIPYGSWVEPYGDAAYRAGLKRAGLGPNQQEALLFALQNYYDSLGLGPNSWYSQGGSRFGGGGGGGDGRDDARQWWLNLTNWNIL